MCFIQQKMNGNCEASWSRNSVSQMRGRHGEQEAAKWLRHPRIRTPILAWPTITLSDEKCEFTVKEFESTNFVCKVNAANISKSQRKGDRKQSPYLPVLSKTQWPPLSQTSPLHDPHNSTAPVCVTTRTDIGLASAIAAPHHDRITNRCQVLGTFTNLVRSV